MKKISLIFLFGIFLLPVYLHAGVLSLDLISQNEGVLGNNGSYAPSISADGQFIVFESDATNLVDNDTNGSADIFVYDVVNEVIERVSVDDEGNEADDSSTVATISADGRYVAFSSNATNLVSDDTNAVADIFVYDRQADTIERVTLDSDEGEINDETYNSVISQDGRYVVFDTEATDVVAGDTNNISDTFVRDRTLGTTERVSVNSAEQEATGSSAGTGTGPSISSDGRYVVFSSEATNLVSGDTNNLYDIFLRDRTLGTTERISVSSSEAEADSISYLSSYSQNIISDDGRYVIFSSEATNLVDNDTNEFQDIFLRDRTLGTTERVSVGVEDEEADGISSEATISPDGRFVAFDSDATNLVDDDTNEVKDVFVRDTQEYFTERISISLDNEEGNDESNTGASFTSSGRYVVYASGASTLVDDDTNETVDIFFAELYDMDGVSSAVEDAAPNNGDVDDDGYDDAIENHITSLVNSVSGGYTTVQTNGDCIFNSNISVAAENTLGVADANYDYPLGVVDFTVTCNDPGDSATVTVFCFCDDIAIEDLIARKYDPNTGEYTTIDSAVLSQVTIGGEVAKKMVYTVTDGGELDDDGLANGIISDPVGFAEEVQVSSGGSSSGSSPKTSILAKNTSAPQQPSTCLVSNLTTNMKRGSKFGEVSQLQKILTSLGFDSGPADGMFGPLTDKATKLFQQSKALDVDGIVGPITRAALNSNCSQ